MSQVRRVMKQTASDYQRHLQDAVNALRLSSEAYDRGFVGEAKRLATTIRVLVHDTDRSKSLLQQMNLKNSIRYYASPNPHDAGNILTECYLVAMKITSGPAGMSLSYLPMLDTFPSVLPWSELAFDDWWKQVIARDNQRKVISRRDLVLAVANKDGGAHIDPNLDALYANLSRNNSLGWKIVTGGVQADPADGPQFACVRQIAHELEKSIQKHLGMTAGSF
jgi:histone H3/H4